MELPRWIVKVIDPVTAYMQGTTPRRTGPMFRGGAVVGPGVPGGARQATPEELDQMRAEATAAGRREPPRETARDVDLTNAAEQLLDQGRTTIRIVEGELTANIVTFWHGDSILHISVHANDRDYSSNARIPRHLTGRHRSMLVSYLSDAVHSG